LAVGLAGVAANDGVTLSSLMLPPAARSDQRGSLAATRHCLKQVLTRG